MYVLLNYVTYLVYVNIVFNIFFNVKVLGRERGGGVGEERERRRRKKRINSKDSVKHDMTGPFGLRGSRVE